MSTFIYRDQTLTIYPPMFHYTPLWLGLEKRSPRGITTAMTSPVQITFEDGLYHVTSRGDH